MSPSLSPPLGPPDESRCDGRGREGEVERERERERERKREVEKKSPPLSSCLSGFLWKRKLFSLNAVVVKREEERGTERSERKRKERERNKGGERRLSGVVRR